jgi:hypothetical protein
MAESATALILTALRWTARLLGALLLLLVLSFFIVEGGPNPAKLSLLQAIQLAAELTALLGFVVLWVWELPGGLLTVGGMLAFYAANYLAVGSFPRGWAFPLLFLPGILALIAWTLSRGCLSSVEEAGASMEG